MLIWSLQSDCSLVQYMVFCVGAAADYQLTCLGPGWNDFLQYFCSYVYNKNLSKIYI